MMYQPVLNALQEQVECYRRLAKLAELQHVHVQQNQTEELLDVLQRRQGVLDQINHHETVIAPAKKRWVDFAATMPADSRERSESLLEEAKRLLQEITAADQNDVLVLQQRKLNIGRQINQTTAAKQVNRTYATAAYGTRNTRMDVSR